MDFFEAQARAHTKTRWLIVLFGLAVLGISAAFYAVISFAYSSGLTSDDTAVAPFWSGERALVTLVVIACVVGGGSLFKWMSLRSGGEAVAQMMGGRRVEPLLAAGSEKQLVNVVEEMAIAAGLPVPAVYILPGEPSINAFAAGLTTSDAVVAVSEGALQQLSRDELQAVIGHEFSHILNGDMRLNLKLAAIIFGILVFALLGRQLLYSSLRSGGGQKKDGGVVALVFMGFALMLLGYIGYFFGRLIQAAVSRQREFLADASAVQFTRNPLAMANTLNKIRARSTGSVLSNPHAGEISHMFFAQCFSSLGINLFATHPPLEERIHAIAPDFNLNAPPSKLKTAPPPVPSASPPPGRPQTVASFMASIGTVSTAQVERTQLLLNQIPKKLHDAAHDPACVGTLILALLIDENAEVRARQQTALNAGKNDTAWDAALGAGLLHEIATLDPLQRLPLFQVALGTLHTFSTEQQQRLLDTAQHLVNADGRISIFEYALLRMLKHHLRALQDPRHAGNIRYCSQEAIADPISVILSFITHAGKSAKLSPEAAFSIGARAVPPLQDALKLLPVAECNFQRLDAALDKLEDASATFKHWTLTGAAHTAAADGVIQPEEAELLRAIAFSLDCPMPPLA